MPPVVDHVLKLNRTMMRKAISSEAVTSAAGLSRRTTGTQRWRACRLVRRPTSAVVTASLSSPVWHAGRASRRPPPAPSSRSRLGPWLQQGPRVLLDPILAARCQVVEVDRNDRVPLFLG